MYVHVYLGIYKCMYFVHLYGYNNEYGQVVWFNCYNSQLFDNTI